MKDLDVQLAINKITTYVEQKYQSYEYIIYGSFVQYKEYYFIEPKDIDVTVVIRDDSTEVSTETVMLDGIDIPIEITAMPRYEVFSEVDRLEPKYLSAMFSFGSYSLFQRVKDITDSKSKSDIRNSISSISSKAYHKGKKKLIVEDDYDEYLGLKNIYHAFNFIHLAMNKFKVSPLNGTQFQNEIDINIMNDIYTLIFETYQSSTGTLEERWKALDTVIKPLYNAYMTEFRKHFPKEIKNG